MSDEQPQHTDAGARASYGDQTPTEQPQNLEQALVRYRQAVDELTHFKTRVREVALDYGQRHDMCQVLDEALVELGLEPRQREYTVELTVTGRVCINVEAISGAAALAAAADQAGIHRATYYMLNAHDYYVTEVRAEHSD